jgi:transposase
LYSSHLTDWRRARDAGELAGLTPQKRGRKTSKPALADEVARLQRQVAKLEHDLYKANTIVDVQKKLASLLGETLPQPTEEDFARGPESSRRRR